MNRLKFGMTIIEFSFQPLVDASLNSDLRSRGLKVNAALNTIFSEPASFDLDHSGSTRRFDTNVSHCFI